MTKKNVPADRETSLLLLLPAPVEKIEASGDDILIIILAPRFLLSSSPAVAGKLAELMLRRESPSSSSSSSTSCFTVKLVASSSRGTAKIYFYFYDHLNVDWPALDHIFCDNFSHKFRAINFM